MTEYIQVSTTTGTKAKAGKIAKTLVKQRMAACVQILGPIQSSYWWNGKLEQATEWLCLIKAQSRNYRRIELAIKKDHPYEVPEILALPILHGSKAYLGWIRKETARKN